MVTSEQLTRIIEYLQGSCETLDNAIKTITENDELDEDCLTEEQLEEIDDHIFNCTTCGWWYEVGECSESDDGEMVCLDCDEE